MGSSTLDVASFAGNLSTDVFVCAGLLIVITLLALYAGSSQAISIGLAAFIAPSLLVLAKSAVFLSGLPLASGTYERALLIVIFAVLVVLIRMMSADILHMTSPMQAIMSAIGATCLVLLVWIGTPALAEWFQFGSTVSSIFQESFRFWWVLVIFALFAFSRM